MPTPARQTVTPSAGLIVAGLQAALRLRAPQLDGSTEMVRTLSVRMCSRLGLDDDQRRLADLCARVRDVGMIGLPDDVVLSSSALSPQQWQSVNRHPVLGAELLDSLSPLRSAVPIVRAHHERWDGEGYPDGLAGRAIPLLSRVIATGDAFVALVSDRPHRRAIDSDVALQHIGEQRDVHFDSRVVDALFAVLEPKLAKRLAAPRRPRAEQDDADAPTRSGGAGSGLADALRALDQLPVFVPARERAMAAAPVAGELVGAIEGSIALTVAILRAAQPAGGLEKVTNVPDAVQALGTDRAAAVIADVPCVPFPWQTPEQALLYHVRLHGQAVARAAHRIAEEVAFGSRDDLICAALLHDVGKLVLARIHGTEDGALDERINSPERRRDHERRTMRLDHASLGALLMERWGLPPALCRAVAGHHSADGGEDLAALVRLADMMARHAYGHAVDRRIMVRLARACGLSSQMVREVLFDLPHSGSQRRRAQPSPLSKRETEALRLLAAGKLYKEIASALDVSTSTIRSHLHSSYSKLNVEDRAQAVLRATEMGWI